MDTLLRLVVRRTMLLAVALSAMLPTAYALAQTLRIGASAPSPVLEGQTISFRYIVVNPSRIALGKTLSVAYTVGDCTLPSCLTKLPAVNLPAKPSGTIAFTAPAGRRAYTLILTIDAIHLTSGRDFYVEKLGEGWDAFHNYVDVLDEGGGSRAFCAETSLGFRFERDDTDHLRMGQPHDPCTSKETGAWTVLPDGVVLSSPALVLGPSRSDFDSNRPIHLFYRRADSLIWTHAWQGKPTVDNADAESLAAFATSAPAAFALDDGRIEVFYRAADGMLANKTLSVTNGWASENKFPAQLYSAPAAGTFNRGLDVVVYRGINGHLWLMARDRRTDPVALWQTPEDLGGVNLRSSPGISAKSSANFLVVEYRGPDDKVWESSWDGKTSWSAPVNTHQNP